MISRHMHPSPAELLPRRPRPPQVKVELPPREATLSEADRQRILARLRVISKMFDDAVRIPGTKITLGWDAVLGLVPVVGDAATTIVSSYFLWEAYRLGASKWTLVKMTGNVLTDFVVGTVPLVGDMIDVAWRANRRNVRLLEKELARHNPKPRV